MFKSAQGVTLAIALALFLNITPAFATEPRNLSLHKQELSSYVASGGYARDLAAVAATANEYVLERISRQAEPREKPAIVFDIDETMLSSVAHIIANDYGYMPEIWDRWVASAQAPAIRPVQIIYDTAVRNQIAVFIITGRKETDQAATEKNLRQAGYSTWTKIIYRPASAGNSLTNGAFKSAARKKLTGEGYTIIANIGDQESDLVMGYAERSFKLPNPFYQYD